MYSLGTVPFSSESDWNQLIGSNATYTKLNWPASTGYNYTVNWDRYSPALYVASPSDPLVQIKVPAGWGHPGGTISVRMPLDATGAVGTDGELLIIDGDKVYNFWQFDRTSATTATAAAYGWTDVVTGTGWGSKTPFLGAGTTAVGASQLGGLLVEAETDAGPINHALQLVVDYALVKPGFTGDAISGDGNNPSGIVQEGAHLGIPPGTPMPAGLSPLGQKVFIAMQQYGAYVVDVAGGATVIRAQANAYDEATMDALWHDMGKVIPMLQQVTPSTSGQTSPTTPAEPTQTILSTIAASGTGISNGDGNLKSGTVNLTLGFNNLVNVTGTPTLTLNDGGVAKYVSGSGTKNLVFAYQIGAGENTTDLAVTSFSLSGVKDASGNSVNLTSAPKNPAGTLVIDTRAATLSSITASGTGITNGSGTLNSGTVRLSVSFDEAVKVSGSPSLTLNNGGVAKYVSGSGTKSLVFDYQIGAGQNTTDLAVTSFNLGGVTDGAGNSVSPTGAPNNPAGTLVIDTKAATLSSIAASGNGITNGNGTLSSGTVRLNVTFDEAVKVSGTPSLTLNNGGVATYVSGAGTNTLAFDYNVASGQDTSDLAVSAFNLNAVTDLAGNALNLANAPTNPAGTLKISTASSPPTTPTVPTPPATSTPPVTPTEDVTAPTVDGVTVTRLSGHSATFTLKMSEDVVVTGTPVLRLKDGRTAVYQGGSGTDELTFALNSRRWVAGSDLRVVGMVLPSSTSITDLDGNEANLSGARTGREYGSGRFSISGTTELEVFTPSQERISFENGAAGALTLSASSKFNGSIRGFGGENTLNLADIGFGAQTTLAYKPSGDQNTRGNLFVSDGVHTAKIQLLGQYSASSFAMSASPTGGTTIHDAFASSMAPTIAKSS